MTARRFRRARSSLRDAAGLGRITIAVAIASAVLLSVGIREASIMRSAVNEPNAPPPVSTEGFTERGVTLSPSTDQTFDSRVRARVHAHLNDALALKPVLFLLTNGSDHTIVAYTLIVTAMTSSGTHDTSRVYYYFPDAVAGSFFGQGVFERGAELYPGEVAVLGRNVEITHQATLDWLPDYVREQQQWLSNVVSLDARLDAALFSDGELIGPNTSKLDRLFVGYLKAKQDVYREILEKVDAGSSVDEAFRLLRSRPRPSATEIRADPVLSFPPEAAAEARSWRQRLGDTHVVSTFRAAIRTEPFVIRRADG